MNLPKPCAGPKPLAERKQGKESVGLFCSSRSSKVGRCRLFPPGIATHWLEGLVAAAGSREGGGLRGRVRKVVSGVTFLSRGGVWKVDIGGGMEDLTRGTLDTLMGGGGVRGGAGGGGGGFSGRYAGR